MTTAPGCSPSHVAGEGPECSRPLVLAEALRQWQREAQQGTVDTGRYRCRYFTWGRGPSLVFVPGLSLGATSFVMAMSRLKSQFRCIGYELPGANDDGASLAAYHHHDLRDDLFALLDHLRVERGYLLGFSFGSTVALAALADQPRRFPRAVLVSGFARRPLAWAEVMLAHWVRYCPGRIGDVPGMDRRLRDHHAALYTNRAPDELDFFCAEESRPRLRTFAARALVMHHTDLRPLLRRIAQPTLLVYGDHEPLVNQQYRDELKQGLPSAARAEIERCGHYPQLTHPEVFSELIRQFLTPGNAPAIGE